jgi:hypothetical protein
LGAKRGGFLSKAKDVQYVKHYPKMLGPAGEEFVEVLAVLARVFSWKV